jgi:hypothetical protein
MICKEQPHFLNNRHQLMKRLSLVILIFLLNGFLHIQAQNWTDLFDGKTLNGWKQLTGTAKFEVKDGAIRGTTVPNSPNSFLVTEKTYGDFALELEVLIEDEGSNSGIQFRSQYDAAGNNGKGRVYGYQYELDPSARMWSAGIYDEGRRDWLYPLSLNASAQKQLHTGVFHKVRIECRGSDIRTWINKIPAAHLIDAVDANGFIALQVHSIGDPKMAGKHIWWRNIKIQTGKVQWTDFPADVFVVNTGINQLSAFEKKAGWSLLFDGQSSKGWKGAYKPGFPEKGWEIVDGELRVLSSGGAESTNGGDIVTREKYSAFDLSFEFKLSPGANSGVKYFVTLKENNPGSAIGLEYQLLDDEKHPDAKMGRDGNRTLSSLYDLIRAEKQARFVRPPGEWNRGRIVVYPDNRVEHYLNGVKVVEYTRGSKSYRDLVAISKYKVWENFGEAPEGHILLQDHGDAVSFRSIKLKRL